MGNSTMDSRKELAQASNFEEVYIKEVYVKQEIPDTPYEPDPKGGAETNQPPPQHCSPEGGHGAVPIVNPSKNNEENFADVNIKEEILVSIEPETLLWTDDQEAAIDLSGDKLACRDAATGSSDNLVIGGKKESAASKDSVHKFQCASCQKSFRDKCSLAVHQRIHTGERPYACSTCGKTFSQKPHLNVHLRTHTGKPFECNICGKQFAQKGNLRLHYRKHTGDKPFSCEVCNKDFAYKSNLTLHYRMHNGDRPHSCKICGLKFNEKSYLAVHHRTHSGEKPIKCEICGMGFRQRSNLNVHQWMHTGKPFACDLCEKRFTQKSTLTVHYRTHTGEAPFVCQFCDMRFIRRASLTVHLRAHTGEMFACDTCGQKFNEKSNLARHYYTLHTDKPALT